MSRKRIWLRSLLLLAILVLPTLRPIISRAATTAYDPNVLSYGIYWFGLNDVKQKFVSGEENPYFDPSKPTLLFIHGWQPGISASDPPNFTYTYLDGFVAKNINTANAWINDGWNVGIFYWNQFSDEPDNVQYAEAKIWTPDGPKGMRWRKGDGTYEDAPEGTPSAGELLYSAYVEAMTEETYTGGNIRFAGHSLGNQMAMRLTKLVHDGIANDEIPEHLRPTRVALLDPYWSLGAKDYLDGKTTGEMPQEYMAELATTGTLFEWYWSSSLTVSPNGDTNDALKPAMLYVAMDPDHEGNAMSKHCAAYHLYFWSYAFDGPGDCTGDACLSMNKVLSRMSDTQLAAVTRSDYRWSQVAGNLTATPEDDVYQSAAEPNTPYTITQLMASTTTPAPGDTVIVTATVKDSTDNAVADGTLVNFATDLGKISARAVTSNGLATAQLTSNISGTANIDATTYGAGGKVQASLAVTFTGAASTCDKPLTGVGIEGPVGVSHTLYVNSSYTFNAVITPTDATTPITYTWSPEPANGADGESAIYRWSTPGTYTITLTAENCGGVVTATHAVTIESCPRPLTGVAIGGPESGTATFYVGTRYTFNAIITPTDATTPITYTWSPEPVNGQNDSIAHYEWSTPGTYTITLTAANCGGAVTAEPRVFTVLPSGTEYKIYLPVIKRESTQ